MDGETTVLALTGPPAAGKSTVTTMLDDMGVPCKSTGDAVREEAERRYDDPDEDTVWDVAQDLRDEHGDAGPTIACRGWIEEQSVDNDVICVSDLRDQAEVDWLTEKIGPTLVIKVDADDYQRSQRYVDRELDEDEERESVSRRRVKVLREELYEREYREKPYPDHDLTLWNSDSVNARRLWAKLDNLVEVLRA